MNTMPSGFQPLVLDDPVFDALAPIYFRIDKGWRREMIRSTMDWHEPADRVDLACRQPNS